MSSDDDDIFCYTPLTRNKSFTQSSPVQKPVRYAMSQQVLPKSKLKKPTKRPPTNSPFKTPLPAPKKKKLVEKKELITFETEVCPVCQMPWVTLGLNGKRILHTHKCSLVDFSIKTECPQGLTCQEYNERHYMSYSHQLWAELRAKRVGEQDTNGILSNPSDRKHHNDDSGYEDGAVAGTSGWRPKLDFKQDLISHKEEPENSSSDSTPQYCKSVILFDIGDEDSLPDLSSRKSPEVPDLDFNLIKEERGVREDDQSAVIFPPRFSQTLARKDDDENTVVYSPEHVERSSSKDDENSVASSTHLGNSPVCGKNNVNVAGVRKVNCNIPDDLSSRSSDHSSYTHVYDAFNDKQRGKDIVSETAKRADSQKKNSAVKDVFGSSGTESPSLLQNQDQNFLTNAEAAILNGQLRCERPSSEPDAHKPDNCNPSMEDDDEFEADDYEVLNRLVDEAVDKYISKSQTGTKCFHLHIHYSGSCRHSSPQKKGSQKSILNYFKPVNTKDSAENGDNTDASSCCSQCCEKKGKQTTAKQTNVTEWKALMSTMQKNSKQANGKQTSSLGQQGETSHQPNQRKGFYGGGGNRPCPFYKYIPDTSFVVDAFCYGYIDGIDGYFLSHFHYDHYRGLTRKFNKLIYCSSITAKLVNIRLGVQQQYLRTLPMDEPQVISGVEVTLLDANHCPGSVMFLYKLPTGSTILHVGDFRAHPKMESYPALWNCTIDTLYLDTTYCKPIYDFPSQDEILDRCVSIASSHVADNPKTLIVVGSYSIGKERVFRAIAVSLDCCIWASGDKQRTLRCIEDDVISAKLTSDKSSARVHVVPMKDIHPKKLADYIANMKSIYNEVVAIRPTGWEHTGNDDEGLTNLAPKKFGNVYIYGIPYSEHSSYNELRRFVRFIRPKKVIPTVNVGNVNARKSMEQEFHDWLK